MCARVRSRAASQDFVVPDVPTALKFVGTYLCVSVGSRFRMVDMTDLKILNAFDLPNREDRAVAWVYQAQGLAALTAFQIKREFLLCFNSALARAPRDRSERTAELTGTIAVGVFSTILSRCLCSRRHFRGQGRTAKSAPGAAVDSAPARPGYVRA